MAKIELVVDRSITKRPCVYKRVGNALYPIMYFHKAKSASNEDFEIVYNYLIRKDIKNKKI